MVRIDYGNYGMFSTKRLDFSDIRFLERNKIRIDSQKDLVTIDEIPTYRIKRKCAKRKAQGMYKELKPTLELIQKEEIK